MEDKQFGLCTIYLNSGAKLEFVCEEVTTERSNTTGKLTSLSMTGITSGGFLYMNLDDISAVLWNKGIA